MSEEQSGPLPKSPNERINLVATVTSLHHENKRLREQLQLTITDQAITEVKLAAAEKVVEASRIAIKSQQDIWSLNLQPLALVFYYEALSAYDAAKGADDE